MTKALVAGFRDQLADPGELAGADLGPQLVLNSENLILIAIAPGPLTQSYATLVLRIFPARITYAYTRITDRGRKVAHAVIQEAKDAGVYLFTGGLDEDVEPVMVASGGTPGAAHRWLAT